MKRPGPRMAAGWDLDTGQETPHVRDPAGGQTPAAPPARVRHAVDPDRVHPRAAEDHPERRPRRGVTPPAPSFTSCRISRSSMPIASSCPPDSAHRARAASQPQGRRPPRQCRRVSGSPPTAASTRAASSFQQRLRARTPSPPRSPRFAARRWSAPAAVGLEPLPRRLRPSRHAQVKADQIHAVLVFPFPHPRPDSA